MPTKRNEIPLSDPDFKTLGEKRDALAKKMREMHETAEKEDRSFTKSEREAWDMMTEALEAMDGAIPVRRLPHGTIGSSHDYSDDAEVRALRKDESFEEFARGRCLVDHDTKDLSLQKTLRGLALGDWRGAELEQRAISAGSGTGQFLIPTLLASSIFDMARSLSTVFRAGARAVPIDGDTDVATVVSDPVMGWRAENASVAESDMTFGTVQLRPKSVACLSTASHEFLQDAVGGEEAIRYALAQAIASEIDRVCLLGTGTGSEPTGIMAHASVQETELGSADGAVIDSYLPLSTALFDLAAQDCPMGNIHAIMSPRSAKSFDQLADGDGNPKQPPWSYHNAVLLAQLNTGEGDMPSWGRQLMSSKVPNDQTVGTSSDCSTIFMGDFAQSMLIGMRLDPTIIVLTERMADKLQVQFLIHSRMDVALPYPKHLLRITGVRA